MAALTLLGFSLAAALPAGKRLQDRMAVVGAREAVMGIFHQARMEAVARGGARVRLRTRPAAVELWCGGAVRASLDLAVDYGVGMTLSGEGEEAEILLDGLGLGRVASRTIDLTRNGSGARLVVSSLGRLRRE